MNFERNLNYGVIVNEYADTKVRNAYILRQLVCLASFCVYDNEGARHTRQTLFLLSLKVETITENVIFLL
jgi:hypothetical protein